MTYLLPSKAQKVQKGFTPKFHVFQSGNIVIAQMIIGQGSYFTHTLGVYKDKKTAINEGMKEFKAAKKLLKK